MNRLLYSQEGFPVLQNRVYDSLAAAVDCPRGDIRLVEDNETGLIYNAAFDGSLLQYDAEYNNEQGWSRTFREHLKEVEEIVDRFMGREKLLEVGCGKGLFLEILLKEGFDICGFDATYDGSNDRIEKRNFESGVIRSPSRGLILRHVLEHIPDPLEFLLEIKAANGGGGLIYIEVPCFDWICRHRAWYDIFYEHVNYFRLKDFQLMFETIHAIGHFFGGQYLYVVADLETVRCPRSNPSKKVDFPVDFGQSIYNRAQPSPAQPSPAQPRVIWGAASKGTIYSLLRERAGIPVNYAVDLNPAKVGKFLPASGVRVLSVEDAVRVLPPGTPIVVMNPNYLPEIRELVAESFPLQTLDE